MKKMSGFTAFKIDGTYCNQEVIYSKGFGSISHVVVHYVNCIGRWTSGFPPLFAIKMLVSHLLAH